MDESEADIRVPFTDGEGNTEWVTIIVQIRPDMTMDELDLEIADAITEFVQNRQGSSDRLVGFEPEYNNAGEYEYEIGTPLPSDLF